MKKILTVIFLFACINSFAGDSGKPVPGSLEWFRSFNPYFGGNWTLSGAKNQWGNGMSWGSKSAAQLAAFNNGSDTILMQVNRVKERPTFRFNVADPWNDMAYLTDITTSAADSNFWRKVSLSTVTLKAPMSNLSLTGKLTTQGEITVKASENDAVIDTSGVFYGNGFEMGHTNARGADLYAGIIYNGNISGYGLTVNAGATRGRPGFFLSDYTNTDSVINASLAGVWIYKPVNLTASLTTTGAVQAAGLTIVNNATIGGNLTVTGSISAANIVGQSFRGTTEITSVAPNANLTISGIINTAGLTVSGSAAMNSLTVTGVSNIYGGINMVIPNGTSRITIGTALGGIGNPGIVYKNNGVEYWENKITVDTTFRVVESNVLDRTRWHKGGYLEHIGTLAITGGAYVNSLSVTGQVQAQTITVAGNIFASSITGLLTTAAQPNITSVGTLSSLIVSGAITTGSLTTSGTINQIAGTNGYTTLGIRNYSTGTSAAASLDLGNDIQSFRGELVMNSSTYTPNGIYQPDGLLLYSGGLGGLTLAAASTSGAVRVYSGNSLAAVFNASAQGLSVTGSITGASIKKSGGTSSQFLMADGSVSIGTSLPYVAKTATYTVTLTDYFVNATSGTFTITLPTAASALSGGLAQSFVIKNSGSGTITLAGNGAETIDGTNTKTMVQYVSYTVTSTGTGWFIN